MKKFLSLFLCFVMVLGIMASVPVTSDAASVADLTFALSDKVTGYIVNGCNPDASGEIVIPNAYKGKPVTGIGGWAFEDCTKLTSVIIPGSVTSIGSYAFDNCIKLKTITLPYSVTSIGNCAFYDCRSLTAINVDLNNRYYSGVSGVLFNKNKTELVQYPKGKKAASYKIPAGVTSIGSYAFINCTELTKVTIPDGVTSIGYCAFRGCRNLTTIKIPGSVTSIDGCAFYECTSLAKITIPDGVTSISYSAFCDCTSLTSVAIPKSVTSIGRYAFDECTSLKYVFYSGDRSSWKNVSMDSKNEYLTSAIIHYNATDHVYKWVVVTAETCTKAGVKRQKCKFCNKNGKSKEIPASGHSYSDNWTIDVAPTCQSNGSKSHHCTKCDAKKNVTVIKPVPHQFSEWKIIKNATSESYGQKVSTCDVCGSTEYAIIKKLICKAPKVKTITNTVNGVKITWDKVTGADKYRVYRKTGKSGWESLGSTTKTYYTDKTAKSGEKCYYAIKAINESGDSKISNTLSIRYLADPTLKTPTSKKSGITLKWSKVTGAQGYIVYRKTGSGSYTKLKTEKGISNLSYVDKSAKKGKKYTYKVKAYYGKTYSAYSNTKTIKDKY